ncbi:unnamed protein product [Polarella glacialis]|nr:unnamed protein product [Polarella glacialis]
MRASGLAAPSCSKLCSQLASARSCTVTSPVDLLKGPDFSVPANSFGLCNRCADLTDSPKCAHGVAGPGPEACLAGCELSAPILDHEEVKLNETTSPVQDLVELLVALVKQSGSLTTSQKSMVSRLNTKLTGESLPAVEAAQQKDQALVNYHASVVAGCDTSMSQHFLALGSMARSIATLKTEHEQCETDRAGFLAERHTASSEFTAWLDAEAAMTPSNAVPQDESEVEAWVAKALSFYKRFNATYTEFKVTERNAVVEAKIEVTNCTGELTGYTESYCSWAEAISVVTSTYTTCGSGAMSLYNATLASVKASATARQTEVAGFKKSQCLLNALVLDDSGVSGELDACEAASSDTSGMIITEPALAGYSQTLVAEMGTPSDSSIACSDMGI